MRKFAAVVLMLAGLSLSAVAFAAPVHHAKSATKSTSAHVAKSSHHTHHKARHHVAHVKHHMAKKSAHKK